MRDAPASLAAARPVVVLHNEAGIGLFGAPTFVSLTARQSCTPAIVHMDVLDANELLPLSSGG